VGVNDAALSERKDQNLAAASHILRTADTRGGITPTLTRSHQGGGNPLTICEYRSRKRRRGLIARSTRYARDDPALLLAA
jgi:hypothetical protein